MVRKTRTNTEVIKTKIFTVARNIRSNETNNKSRAAYTFLSSLYRDISSEQLKPYYKLSDEDLIKFMKKQHAALTKPSSTKVGTNSNIVDIPMDDTKLQDFFLMMWLDMAHDKIINEELNFNEFIESETVKLFYKNRIIIKNTDLLEEYINANIVKKNTEGIYTRMSTADAAMVAHFKSRRVNSVLNIPKTESSIRNRIINRYKPIYVSFDAENAHYISDLIKSSVLNNINARGEPVKTYYLKRIYTIANLMDPGRGASRNVGGHGKAGGTIDELISRIFHEEPYSPFKHNYQLFEFRFGNYFTIKIDNVSEVSKFNVVLTNNQGTNTLIRTGVKRNNANTIKEKLSKTFGDLMQILTVAHLRKSGHNVVSSTQDRAFVGVTGFVQQDLFGINPAIITENALMGVQGTIGLYGLKNYIRSNVTPTRSTGSTFIPINRKNIYNNNTSSGRTISTSVNNRTISGNSTNSTNSTNTNMVEPLRKKQKQSNNTLTEVSAIRNNKNNKNNNEVTSGIKSKMNFGIGPNFRKLGNAREQLNKLTSLTPKQTTKRMRNNNKTPNAIPVANPRITVPQNLRTRITAPQKPIINLKRPRNNNKTPNATLVANTRRVTRSQTTKKIKR
jgi:hypothetical protein